MTEERYQYLHLFLSHDVPVCVDIPKNSPFAILPNIVGIRYVIGCIYPGKRENEEFIFYQFQCAAARIQCHIYSGNKGKFWISPGSESSKTFVNFELLEDPLPLNEGDNISFGLPRGFDDSTDCPVFLVKLEQLAPVENQGCITQDNEDDPVFLGNIPSTLDVLPSIFKFLNIHDLKSCSLVSKMWHQEARKSLENNGTVTIPFTLPYYDPNNSMRIFKYLNQQNPLKIRHLTIAIPELYESRFEHCRSVYEKKFHDFEKFLSSKHNFTSLTITSSINNSKEYAALVRILETLGENLVELKFSFIVDSFSEALVSPIVLPLSKLRKFSDSRTYGNEWNINQTAWFASIQSSFRKTLKELTLNYNARSVVNLQESIKSSPSMLKRLELRSSICAWSEEFECLMELEAQLETLIISVRVANQGNGYDVSNFLERNAKTLTKLRIELHVFSTCKTPITFLFSAFPILLELKLSFSKNVRINFEGGELDYDKHFQRLRILEIHQTRDYSVWDKEQSKNDLFEWETPDSVFSSFFPAESGKICWTVEKLNIDLLKEKKKSCEEEYRKYHLRLLAIPEMFPKVALKDVLGDLSK